MNDDLVKTVYTGIEENEAGVLTVTSRQDVSAILKANAEARQADVEQGRQLVQGAALKKVATIPTVVVMQWANEGFYLSSPERSNMTPEEHRAELKRRLNGDWAKLATSRFKHI